MVHGLNRKEMMKFEDDYEDKDDDHGKQNVMNPYGDCIWRPTNENGKFIFFFIIFIENLYL